MDVQDIAVDHTFQDGNGRLVKVTRIWTDTNGTGVAFDIYGTDQHGSPAVSHSAMDISLFADLYTPTA